MFFVIALKTEFRNDDVKTARHHGFIKLTNMFAIISQSLVLRWLFQTMTAVFGTEEVIFLVVEALRAANVKKPAAASAVRKLYEVRAKAEDAAQLRTGSDTK